MAGNVANSDSTVRTCYYSDDPGFPTTTTEDESADDRERRECDRDGGENTFRTHAKLDAQEITERNFPQPEHKQVDDRGRPGVPRAVK